MKDIASLLFEVGSPFNRRKHGFDLTVFATILDDDKKAPGNAWRLVPNEIVPVPDIAARFLPNSDFGALLSSGCLATYLAGHRHVMVLVLHTRDLRADRNISGMKRTCVLEPVPQLIAVQVPRLAAMRHVRDVGQRSR